MAFPIALLSAPLPWLALAVSKIFRSKKDQKPQDPKDQSKGSLKSSLFPRSLKITREGRWYIGALVLIGFAAINTGNNLLYLVVAMLLSLIIISGILSESTLRGLRVRRTLPTHAHQDKEVSLKMVVTNTKKKLPSYSFTIEEAIPKKDPKDFRSKIGYVLKLDPASETTYFVKYRFKKRGRVKLTTLRIKTRFPFGLFIKGKLEETPGEIIVYPATKAVSATEDALAVQAGTLRIPKAGIGVELHDLKEYRPGDDSRYIDWKASARARSVMRKEFEEESERKITVIFKNLDDRTKSFEEAVTEAASLAKHYLEEDYSVALKTLSGTIAHAKGSVQLEEILHTLALIKPVKQRGAALVEVRGD